MSRVGGGCLRASRSARRVLLAWAVVCSLLVTVGVAGSPGVVSAAAQVNEGAIDSSGERLLAGATRYSTAVALAERATDVGAGAGGVVVVSGESLVDALSAVPLAAARSGVVVLTRTAALPAVVREFVRAQGVNGVSVVGGTAAVADAVAVELGELVGRDRIDRFAGADRYETAVAVARAAGAPGGWCGEAGPAVLLVNGESLVDGVLAAPVAYAMSLPLLFTRAGALPEVVRGYLADAGVARAVTIGSDAAISPAVEAELAGLNVEVTPIDGATPAARSVALADAAAQCGATSGEFALVDADVPIDGVAAAALLANGIQPGASSRTLGANPAARLVPMLAVSRELPSEVAAHLSRRATASTTDDVTIYALGGTARITPELMRDAIDAADPVRPGVERVASSRANRSERSRSTSQSLARNLPAGTSTATASTSSTTSSTVLSSTTIAPPSPSMTPTEPPSTTSLSTSISATTVASDGADAPSASAVPDDVLPPLVVLGTSARPNAVRVLVLEEHPHKRRFWRAPLASDFTLVVGGVDMSVMRHGFNPFGLRVSFAGRASELGASGGPFTVAGADGELVTVPVAWGEVWLLQWGCDDHEPDAGLCANEPAFGPGDRVAVRAGAVLDQHNNASAAAEFTIPAEPDTEPPATTSTTTSDPPPTTSTTVVVPPTTSTSAPAPTTTTTVAVPSTSSSTSSSTTTSSSTSTTTSSSTSTTSAPLGPTTTTTASQAGGAPAQDDAQGPSPGTTSTTSTSSTTTTTTVPMPTTTELAPTTTTEVPPTTTSSSSTSTSTTTSSSTSSTSPTSSSTTTSSSSTTTTTAVPSAVGPAVPSGSFTAVIAGNGYSCGLLAAGSLSCWGDEPLRLARAVSGLFASVAASADHACGLRVDGSMACWGSNSAGQSFAPSGLFSRVAVGLEHSCGLRVDRTVACWGDDGHGQSAPPSGPFTAIAAGAHHSCGLRVDRTVACWGDDGYGQSAPPSGSFSVVSAAADGACGLRVDGSLACWGADRYGQLTPPPGSFGHVVVGAFHSCGVRTDGRVACWGSGNYGQSAPPSGSFTDIAVGWSHSCGLRADGTIVCWGSAGSGQLSAPSVADDGSLVWPSLPSVCRPQGPGGFPSDGLAEVSDGTFDVLVVFAEFGDARHDPMHASWAKAEGHLDAVEAYIEAQSYGELDVVFTDLGGWVTVGESYEDYLTPAHPVTGSRHLTEEAEWRALMEAKARGVDVTRGGARFDSLLLIAPPSHFHGGIAGGYVPTDDIPVRSVHSSGRVFLSAAGAPTVRSVAHSGTFPFKRAERRPDAPMPVFVTAHELMHNLGLNDLYSVDAIQRYGAPSGRADDYVEAVYGRMGLRVFWPAEPNAASGTPASDTPQLASGVPASDVTVRETRRSELDEALGWSRWRLDWLDASQVDCVEPGETRLELAPVANPADGTALAVIPISSSELLVLEARRRVGYDADRLSGTDGAYVRHLAAEGVLAYVVDPRFGHGQLATTLFGDDGTGVAPRVPVFGVGESATLHSDDGSVVEFDVSADDGTNFRVDVDWQAGTAGGSRPTCPAGTAIQAFLDRTDEHDNLVTHWVAPKCGAHAVRLRHRVYSLPSWSARAVTSRIAVPMRGVTVAAGETSYAVPVPDSPEPLVVEVQLRHVGDDSPFRWSFSGVICPHKRGYAASVDGATLARRDATRRELRRYAATYQSACGNAPPSTTGSF